MENFYDENKQEDSFENTTEELNETNAEESFDPEESFFGGGDKTYIKKADKYEDVKSSAWTMMIVGILGIIFDVLAFTEVIKIPFNPTTAWLFYGIMTLVFVSFVVAGIYSYFKAVKINEEAKIENQKIDEINTWATANLNKDYIDSGLDLNETVEILYFSRAEKIKNLLMHEFEDVDEGLIDLLTESIYTKLYEDDEAFEEEYEYEEETQE